MFEANLKSLWFFYKVCLTCPPVIILEKEIIMARYSRQGARCTNSYPNLIDELLVLGKLAKAERMGDEASSGKRPMAEERGPCGSIETKSGSIRSMVRGN